MSNVPLAASTQCANTGKATNHAASHCNVADCCQHNQATAALSSAHVGITEDQSTAPVMEDEFHLYTYHITYLPSYRVPVLFFSAQQSGDADSFIAFDVIHV